MDSKTFNSLAEAYTKVYSEVDEAYTVTAADKKGNTPAYQNFKAGKKGKDGKPMYKAADHMKEGIRDVDPEKGTAERKAKLEKKRGMKLDDHPQYKKEEVENVDELYKGKHGQSDKEYADSRSQGGKMISGDSKRSGAEYTHGRRVKAANPGMQPDVGGKTKPKSQGKMDKGTRADLTFRKAALRKEELEGNPVYEATKADIKEFVGQALNSAGQALSTPVGAGLAAGTVGAVTGGKKKVKKSLATGAGAAAGAALGGLPGAVIGGIAGNALS